MTKLLFMSLSRISKIFFVYLPPSIPFRQVSFRVVEVVTVDEEGGPDLLGVQSVEHCASAFVGTVVKGQVHEGWLINSLRQKYDNYSRLTTYLSCCYDGPG